MATGGTRCTFILLRDCVYDNTEGATIKETVTHEEGSLLEALDERGTQPPPKGALLLRVLGNTATQGAVLVRKPSVAEVPPEFVDILQAVPKKRRLGLFLNKIRLEEVADLKNGSKVRVINKIGIPPKATGILRYKGELQEEVGVWFGVELDPEFSKLGTTNGTWRQDLCFSCEDDCGLFLNGSQLLARDPPYEIPLDIGQRITFWQADDWPEKGVVKWLGFLSEDRSLKDAIAGIEAENPVGKGNGMYKGKRLFLAKKNHSVLLQVDGLHPEEVETETNASASSPDRGEVVRQGKSSEHYRPNIMTSNVNNNRQSEETAGLGERGVVGIPNTTETNFFEQSSETSGTEIAKTLNAQTSDVTTETATSHHEVTNHADDMTEVKVVQVVESSRLPETSTPRETQAAGPQLEKGSRVKVFSGPPEYGVIKWVGHFPGNPNKLIAGVKMEKSNPAAYMRTGSHGGMHLFSCEDDDAVAVAAADDDDNGDHNTGDNDGQYKAYFCCLDQLEGCNISDKSGD